MSQEEELVNFGLFVIFIVCIEDVMEKVLGQVVEDMVLEECEKVLIKIFDVVKEGVVKEDYQDVVICFFFYGKQYFMFIMEIYCDICLVGVLFLSIGKFGVDIDNWEWLCYIGDFFLFCIYIGFDGKFVEYSESNVLMKLCYYLFISLDGVEEGDFMLVFGFFG